MKINVELTGGRAVVSLDGRMDPISTSELEKILTSFAEEGCPGILIDCAGLKYISSSGLRVFLLAQKKLNSRKGQLRLCSLQPEIREIFDIANFSMIFSIYADRESAMAEML